MNETKMFFQLTCAGPFWEVTTVLCFHINDCADWFGFSFSFFLSSSLFFLHWVNHCNKVLRWTFKVLYVSQLEEKGMCDFRGFCGPG